jgi:hypothetical protein
MGERAGLGAHRDELLAGVTGTVLEVGADGGLCFDHYPASANEVLATEPVPDEHVGAAERMTRC